MNNLNLEKSIKNILNLENWKEEFGSSLERNIATALNKPIGNLSTEELRMLLNQELYLEIVVPVSLERLSSNTFLRSEDTDVLLVLKLLQINNNFWNKNVNLKKEFINLTNNILNINNSKNISEDELLQIKQLLVKLI